MNQDCRFGFLPAPALAVFVIFSLLHGFATLFHPWKKRVHLDTVLVAQPSRLRVPAASRCEDLLLCWIHAAGRRLNSQARTPALRFHHGNAKDSVKMHPEETCWKNFSRQTASVDLKCNYRHCPISMPVVDIIFAASKKWSHWWRLDGGGDSTVVATRRWWRPNSVRNPVPRSCPGILFRTQGHGLTSEGSQPAGLDIWLCQFHQKQ